MQPKVEIHAVGNSFALAKFMQSIFYELASQFIVEVEDLDKLRFGEQKNKLTNFSELVS